MKIKCIIKNCNNMAVWHLMSGSEESGTANISYCDFHVDRGCSCNINPNTGIEDCDEEGRLYPCCEYCYYEFGWDEDEEDYEHDD